MTIIPCIEDRNKKIAFTAFIGICLLGLLIGMTAYTSDASVATSWPTANPTTVPTMNPTIAPA